MHRRRCGSRRDVCATVRDVCATVRDRCVTVLSLAISEDEGDSWRRIGVLRGGTAPGLRFHYPWVLQMGCKVGDSTPPGSDSTPSGATSPPHCVYTSSPCECWGSTRTYGLRI
eukprot:1506219-Pyramimonas_sp.AAC.2